MRNGGKDKPKPPKDEKCDNDCLLIKVKKLVFELTCTLRFVIIKLGLGKFVQILRSLWPG